MPSPNACWPRSASASATPAAPRHHRPASGRPRRRPGARRGAPGAAGPAQARGCRHLRQLARDRRARARRPDRGLHPAAGRAVAADAGDGRRPPGPPDEDGPAHLRRSASGRRPAERGAPPRTWSSWWSSTARNTCSTGPTTSTWPSCAAPRPTRTATSRWRRRRSSSRCCPRRRRPGAGRHVVVQVKRLAARHAASEDGEDPRHPGRSRRRRPGAVADLRHLLRPRPTRASSACRSRTSRRCRSGRGTSWRGARRWSCSAAPSAISAPASRPASAGRGRGGRARRAWPDQRAGHHRRRPRAGQRGRRRPEPAMRRSTSPISSISTMAAGSTSPSSPSRKSTRKGTSTSRASAIASSVPAASSISARARAPASSAAR